MPAPIGLWSSSVASMGSIPPRSAGWAEITPPVVAHAEAVRALVRNNWSVLGWISHGLAITLHDDLTSLPKGTLLRMPLTGRMRTPSCEFLGDCAISWHRSPGISARAVRSTQGGCGAYRALRISRKGMTIKVWLLPCGSQSELGVLASLANRGCPH